MEPGADKGTWLGYRIAVRDRGALEHILAQLSVKVTLEEWDGELCTLKIHSSCDPDFVVSAIQWRDASWPIGHPRRMRPVTDLVQSIKELMDSYPGGYVSKARLNEVLDRNVDEHGGHGQLTSPIANWCSCGKWWPNGPACVVVPAVSSQSPRDRAYAAAWDAYARVLDTEQRLHLNACLAAAVDAALEAFTQAQGTHWRIRAEEHYSDEIYLDRQGLSWERAREILLDHLRQIEPDSSWWAEAGGQFLRLEPDEPDEEKP